MARHAGELKLRLSVNKGFALVFLLASTLVHAGDATSNANPALATSIKVADTACAQANEMAVTSAGKPVKCLGGEWIQQGITGLQPYGTTVLIKASEIGSYKTMVQNCPAGKRPIGGGCVLFAGTGWPDSSATLVINTVTLDFTGWQCTWGPLKSWAMDKWPDGGVLKPAQATVGVTCADY